MILGVGFLDFGGGFLGFGGGRGFVFEKRETKRKREKEMRKNIKKIFK